MEKIAEFRLEQACDIFSVQKCVSLVLALIETLKMGFQKIHLQVTLIFIYPI